MLNTILFLLFLYVCYKLYVNVLTPILRVHRQVKVYQKHMKDQMHSSKNGSVPYGDVHINYSDVKQENSSKSKRKAPEDDGEYIDYEEVKD